MQKLSLAPILLALAVGAPRPGTAQEIPDNIPDTPGESPADRAQERLEERFRGFLSRVYTAGSFDLSPIGGFGYQGRFSVGLDVGTGDAVFLSASGRDLPARAELSPEPIGPGRRTETYFGAGLALRGTRLLGEESSLGRRTALNVGVGVLTGETSVLAFEVTPTYDLLARSSWAVPVGATLNVATFGSDMASVTRAFLGLSLGVRWYWGERERLESR